MLLIFLGNETKESIKSTADTNIDCREVTVESEKQRETSPAQLSPCATKVSININIPSSYDNHFLKSSCVNYVSLIIKVK